MLLVVFEEFEMVYVFTILFFSLSLSIGKRSTIAKTWGGGRGGVRLKLPK